MAFVWRHYTSDAGGIYAVKMSEMYAAMPERGYTEAAAPGDPQYPKGWRERRVFGIADDGSIYFADVASTSSPLWTGTTPYFQVLTNSGALAVVTVIGRQSERYLRIPPPS